MSKRIVIFFVVIAAYLTSFIEVKSDNQLFLRNIPLYHPSAKGVVLSNAHRQYLSSQIKVLGIGTQRESASDTWGKSRQIGTHTWTIKVGKDAKNGTPQEILIALNSYRKKYGRGALAWDDKLGEYAKKRVEYFTSIADLDQHAGFTDFINNQDGFHKLGFVSVGENSSYGYTLEAIHLIEWVYAGDKPHDDNQLNSSWHYVGIGVDGVATDLIFGGKKI